MIDEATEVAHPAEHISQDHRLRLFSEDQMPELDLADVLQMIRRDRKAILSIGLAAAVLSAIVALILPTQYSSVASFIPPTGGSSSTAAALASQLSSFGSMGMLGGAKSSGDLYAGILRSRSVGEGLVEKFNLKEVYKVKLTGDAIKDLATKTNVLVGSKDSIITITVTDRSPGRARDLANAYLDALRDTNGRLALTESSQRRLFFDQQLAKEKNDLADAEVELKKSEEHSGLIAPSGQTVLQIETIAKTRAQIAARQIELADLRQSSTDQNPMVVRLRSVISDLEGQLVRLQEGSGNNEPGLISAAKAPAIQLDYVRKAREVKYHEALFELIARQDESARLDEARESPLLQVLDPASFPDRKSGPPRTLITVCGLLIGLAGGCIWALIREFMRPEHASSNTDDQLLRVPAR